MYDCRNRLVSAGGVSYEYDSENVRTAVITRAYREEYVTDSVPILSRVLMSVRTYQDGTTENFKYVYGNGLISQEWKAQVSGKTGVNGLEGSYSAYLTYHFNHLGSTVMLTDETGRIAETLTGIS